MLADELKRRLSGLRREQEQPEPVAAPEPPRGGSLQDYFPEGAVEETSHGEVFVCSLPLSEIAEEASRLSELYARAFLRAKELAEREGLPKQLQAMAEVEPHESVLIDTETAGFHGRPLFLIGLLRYVDDRFVLAQYFAQDYAREAALLARFAADLPQTKLLVSFNGKSFDWPFVKDRMVYHRLPRQGEPAHVDLLHPARRRWKGQLPNCRLQTLERFLCGRWRRGDIPGAEIPQRYHDFVREQEARRIAPIFHHNRLDLITMIEVLVALIAAEAKGSADA